ncbi:MAG: glycosyltransferase [Candidatus Omnitrophica bacterium]|nr:glycosyltransferase [Candidatus Omnitrophota bacterium]
MRLLYDIFFILFSLFYVPYLFFRGRLHRDFPQKFGFLGREITELDSPVWIHAVSVGEASLAAKLAAGIKELFPSQPVIVSTTTRTGNDMIRKLGRGIVDSVFYYPLDISLIVSKTIRSIAPRLFIMIETELWPNMLERMKAGRIPVILANGRISEKSFRNYRRIGPVTARLMNCIDAFYMQSVGDAERVTLLGAPGEKVKIAGNMKFDEQKKEGPVPFTRRALGFEKDAPLIVAGSTHFPEENILIDIYLELRARIPSLGLVIAPRHVERSEAVRLYLEKKGVKYRDLSSVLHKDPSSAGEYNVLMVDTIGHLKDIFGIADVVFIGKSLVAEGGQNPIEAAVWGKPVVFGENMSNFKEVSQIFLENEAALMVKDEEELKKTLESLLTDEDRREALSRNALRMIEKNSGAVRRTLEGIKGYLL